MKWVLIAIHLSTWDNHVTGHEQIGLFTGRTACMEERDRLEKEMPTIRSESYICAESIEGGKP